MNGLTTQTSTVEISGDKNDAVPPPSNVPPPPNVPPANVPAPPKPPGRQFLNVGLFCRNSLSVECWFERVFC